MMEPYPKFFQQSVTTTMTGAHLLLAMNMMGSPPKPRMTALMTPSVLSMDRNMLPSSTQERK